MLLLFVLPGCSAHRTYPGAALPREHVAVIEGYRTIGGIRVFFVGTNYEGEEYTVSKIEVPVGEQTIRVSYHDASRAGVAPVFRTISFRAEGGRTYRLRAVDYGRIWIWIEDTRTRATVGGRKP